MVLDFSDWQEFQTAALPCIGQSPGRSHWSDRYTDRARTARGTDRSGYGGTRRHIAGNKDGLITDRYMY